MAGQRMAGLVIVHDGKLRMVRYGLGFDSAGRWTSFSVAKSISSVLVGRPKDDAADFEPSCSVPRAARR